MKAKLLLFGLFMFFSFFVLSAQVGIGNTNPQSTLDISATSSTTPANNDGILIPRMSVFPTAPGATRDGMLIFYTGTGASGKGFYYWDGTLLSWIFMASGSKNTLDQAYDEGGAGAGRTIIADNGAVTIDGGDESLRISGALGGSGKTGIRAIYNSTINQSITGINQSFNNTANGNFNSNNGLVNSFQNVETTSNGVSNSFGNYNLPSGRILRGFSNYYSGGSFPFAYGFINTLAPAFTTNGNYIGYGNIIESPGTGNRTGFEATLSGSGTGNKYGLNVNIDSGSGGTHYGIYTNVQKSNSYAAYLIGRTSLGIGATNRYLMPETDGNTNQIISTNGSGQLSFVDASTLFSNSDDQTIDVFSLTGTTLNLSLEDDGVITQTVDLSSLQDGTGNDWSLTGNSVIGSSFIGTTNNLDLRFRANNIEKLRLSTQGQLEFYNTGQSVFIGEQAGENDDLTNNFNTFIGYRSGFNTSTGIYNSAIGHNSLLTNQNGSRNLALGSGTLLANTSGSDNIAIGTASLISNTTQNYNIAIGYGALYLKNTGDSNVAIGYRAGAKDASSSQNVYIGYEAGSGFIPDPDENKSGNVFIGYRAGYNENGSNKLYIDNSNTATPLIYGEFDTNVLQFNGDVGIGRSPTTNALEVEGQASKTTAGNFVGNSDKRLKKNIESISGHTALEKIEKMRGVTYLWNDDKTGMKRPDSLQYGFIAQELMEVFPEKVTKDNLGYYQTAYGDYDPLFVEAIKELKNEIDTLKDENQLLKEMLKQFTSLEERLSAIEKTTNQNTADLINVTAEK